jgi:hypothetical protein
MYKTDIRASERPTVKTESPKKPPAPTPAASHNRNNDAAVGASLPRETNQQCPRSPRKNAETKSPTKETPAPRPQEAPLYTRRFGTVNAECCRKMTSDGRRQKRVAAAPGMMPIWQLVKSVGCIKQPINLLENAGKKVDRAPPCQHSRCRCR